MLSLNRENKMNNIAPPENNISLYPFLVDLPLPLVSRESFHVGYYVPSKVEQGDPYGGLEDVWNDHFRLLFQVFSQLWTFGPTEEPRDDWIIFKDMAKVRFACSNCQRGWTTMHGIVVFFFTWDPAINRGEVRFMLTGQNCNGCSAEGFQTPMWYPEEAMKVMTNLFYEICRRYYLINTPPLIKNRRHGRPRQKHDSQKCEGCTLGICYFNTKHK